MEIEFSLSQIDEVADAILTHLGQKKCIAFYASMGSGKTTLIHAVCNKLNVIDAVSSPTFSIINEYHTQKGERVFHMDWYRLKGEEDAIEAGVQDILANNNSYCFVEWPEIASDLLPINVVKISIEIIDANSRKLLIED